MPKTVCKTVEIQRWRILIEGAVQGVGFRPFVYRLARGLGLNGFVQNSSEGVIVEAEGPAERVEHFMARIKRECPPHAFIQKFQFSSLPVMGSRGFDIHDSLVSSEPRAVILPDLATCPECYKEIFDPANRRYRYPFTNCTHCGPRYSIMEQVPYDRHNTSMKKFTMCPACQSEYQDPDNRRFHAQPNACPVCGPQLQLMDNLGRILAQGFDALRQTIQALQAGQIAAVKGLGGFQLMVDACQEQAVQRLRERKRREEKPLAIMVPSVSMAKKYCVISPGEELTLLSAQAPIVLLTKRDDPLPAWPLALSVAFHNPYLGLMLPYTPLHHLIMEEIGVPVVATSGNLSDEPMCFDNDEALNRLGGIADIFLVHDRPIVRPVDDSVGRMIKGRFSLIRRARGFAPMPISVADDGVNVLALGGQMKNTVALKVRGSVYLSQHIGDLHSPESVTAFTQAIHSLRGLYPQAVDRWAADLHPDYFSTRYGHSQKGMLVTIQHHHAHVAACMAEHQLQGPVLGVAWDGTGLGEDKTIWGGEFLLSTLSNFDRVGHLLPFRIPGGESSIRQPKRTALGLLYVLSGGDLNKFRDLPIVRLFSEQEMQTIAYMLKRGLQSPYTTSMGRLFDGVSALLGLCQDSHYEGQAAMLLEYVMGQNRGDEYYPWAIRREGVQSSLDWRAMLAAIIEDVRVRESTAQIAVKFHNTLVEMAAVMAQRVGQRQVVLSGGCFQNKYLTEKLIDRLQADGFEPYWHMQVPANDGGIALGQAVIAAARCKESERDRICV